MEVQLPEIPLWGEPSQRVGRPWEMAAARTPWKCWWSNYGDIFVDIWYTIWPFNIANWKITIYCRYIIYFYGSFSIAMLNNQRVIEKSWFFDDLYIILLYIRDGLVSYPYRFNWGTSESMNGEPCFSTNLCMFSGFEHCSIAMTTYSIMFFDRGTILSFDSPNFENMINDNLKEFEYDEWFSYVFEFFFGISDFQSKCLGIDCLSVATEFNKTCSARARKRERERLHMVSVQYTLW